MTCTGSSRRKGYLTATKGTLPEDGGLSGSVHQADLPGGHNPAILHHNDYRDRKVLQRSFSSAWPLMIAISCLSVLWEEDSTQVLRKQFKSTISV